MSNKKVLNIDPNLFSFSDNNTTKKRKAPKDPESKIRLKIKNKPIKNQTLKKRSILNMIRKHQETNYNTKFGNKSNADNTDNDNSVSRNTFTEATEFFKNLESTRPKQTVSHNHTLKNYGSNNTTPNITTNLPNNISNVTNNIMPSNKVENSININRSTLPAPKYGCLKNGELPTYRNFMNQTRKNIPDTCDSNPVGLYNNTASSINLNDTSVIPDITNKSFINNPTTQLPYVNNTLESFAVNQKIDNKLKNKLKKRKMKRKKVIRRTYKIGRSKIMPKISVLVSNRTIRNNIINKTHQLKQVPLYEMRKYLIKQGFIRVGANTPNDVLRKMYETTKLMCGEIQNHNPDNLLYNFIHETDN